MKLGYIQKILGLFFVGTIFCVCSCSFYVHSTVRHFTVHNQMGPQVSLIFHRKNQDVRPWLVHTGTRYLLDLSMIKNLNPLKGGPLLDITGVKHPL